jgi:UDP-N-acetylmuramoyl-L-alanyl-D-glutamate--2,6-diaminopimelate ligase
MSTTERVGVEWKEMDLKALAERALGQAAPAGTAISEICEDSRRVGPGALFVAVPGTHADGLTFINDAVARGAAAIVSTKPHFPVARPSVPWIEVADPRLAAARLAAVLYGLEDLQQAGALRVVGVTGTNGKSTFAFMLRRLFQCAGRRAALFGTIEYDLVSRTLASDLTTPDAVTLTKHLIEAHGAGAGDVVMEVSSHSLAQRRCAGIAFSIAVFTNLTQDHLDYHGTLDDYLLAKKRLFDSLSPEAAAIVNADDPASAQIAADCRARVVRYGLVQSSHAPAAPEAGGPRIDARATILREDREGGRFLFEFEDRQVELHTPLVGRHNIVNALAAAAAGRAAGLDLAAIRRGLAELDHVPGRLQRVPTGDLGFDVFVDYAHTDDALRNVLGAVRPLTAGRLWCAFGCGGDRDRTKRPRMARAVAEGADAFVITSDNPRTEDPISIIADIERGLSPSDRSADRCWTIPDRARAIRFAIERLGAGDALVIAGKGHENYQIIGTARAHFDDVEAAGEAIRRRQREAVCVP